MKEEIEKLKQQINKLKIEHSSAKSKELYMDKTRNIDYNRLVHNMELLIKTFPNGCDFMIEQFGYEQSGYLGHSKVIDSEKYICQKMYIRIHSVAISIMNENKYDEYWVKIERDNIQTDIQTLNDVIFSPLVFKSKDVERVISLMEWLLHYSKDIIEYNTLRTKIREIEKDIDGITRDYVEFNSRSELPQVSYPEEDAKNPVVKEKTNDIFEEVDHEQGTQFPPKKTYDKWDE